MRQRSKGIFGAFWWITTGNNCFLCEDYCVSREYPYPPTEGHWQRALECCNFKEDMNLNWIVWRVFFLGRGGGGGVEKG